MAIARPGTAGMPKAAAAEKRGLDFYASPYAALPPLLVAERRRLPKVLWEPACGNGALVLPLRNRGFKVIASDIVDRGCPDALKADFLAEESNAIAASLSSEPFGLITNPPFDGSAGGIEEFITRAVSLSPYVAILARLAFLESDGRHHWWDRVRLRRVVIISDRLPMMHREGYAGPKLSNSGQCFAWFIFERGTRTPLKRSMQWVRWKDAIKRFPMTDADLPPTASDQRLPLFAGEAA